MKKKRINSFLLLTLIFLVFFIFTSIIICLLKHFRYAFWIEILVFCIFYILALIITKAILINPILEVNKVLEHYNNNEFGYYCKFDTSTETQQLMNEVNQIGQKYKQSSNKLKESTEENEAYYNQFAQELETKKTLVASISHEIKTPLAVIEASANGILDGVFQGKEVEDALNNIIAESHRTTEMLQEIVQIYKFENRTIPIEFDIYNLRTLIFDILNEVNNLVIKYNQKIEFLSSLDIDINVNYSLMKRALSNIIHNAIVYSPKNERISIELIERPEYHVLEIINYGVTLDKDDLKRVFEPFYRADKSRQKSDDHGNGLGLYMVSEILTRHNLDYGLVNIFNGVKFYIIFKK